MSKVIQDFIGFVPLRSDCSRKLAPLSQPIRCNTFCLQCLVLIASLKYFFLSSDWPLLLCCRLSRAHSIYGTKISDKGSVISGSLEHLVTHSDLEITCVTGHLRGPVSKLYSLQLSKQIPTRHNYFLVFQGSLSKDSGDGILMATYIHLISQPMTTSFV